MVNELREEEIIKRLFVREEDTIKRLEVLVTRLEKFMKIEESTGRVIFQKRDLTIEEKIALALIAKYLYDRVKGGTGELELSSIAKAIGKKITSLPLLIQRLISNGFIQRTSLGKYKINFYRIDDFLDKLEAKEKE
jgi:hypothetical protein